ncbi:7-cyano-7-deazaguanine synthase [Microbacterium sp. UBA837]|uniref:7-cyano-7-deazaguanine synthase n=1 Tax=Microbacterium sp. UBA837 TaxID=1946956 RepID=UPI002601330A|nr:7-cyano-7-deazaguanine synthase [Microbacterium sp. UBA837]|tara:strand:+ start:27000 stop:28265 length:1266 start_codon:yes stop_codon:yes gene_type:complete
MQTHQIEVLPAGSSSTGAGLAFAWSTKDVSSADLASTMTWDLGEFAAAPVVARDLFRIAAAAYFADTAIAKPEVSLHRNFELTVHIEDPSSWRGSPISSFADILHWLTGDSWSISLKPATARLPLAVSEPAARVQLLSGGLDSLCGAVIGLRGSAAGVRFVGHRDASKAVRRAQNAIADTIVGPPYDRYELYIRDSKRRKNHGPRSRSLMFMALGVVTAAAHSAPELWVPENGFTSINPPLDAGRGGALTTRSTHPYTFHLLSRLLTALQIDVVVINPFANLTKAELVAVALPELMSDQYRDSATTSFSCAKGGTQFHHGDSNHNCGLCVACVVRRAAFLGAGIDDPTPYDCELLVGANLAGLVKQRWRDVISLRDVIAYGIDEDAILSATVWPPDTDLDAVLQLVDRGLEELRRVPLPAP